MLVAWPQALYGRMQSTKGILCEVRKTAATQQNGSPLRRQKKRGKTVNFDATTE